MVANADHPRSGPFTRRSFVIRHYSAGTVQRPSLGLNPFRIKFINNQGVALWQRRRRARRARRNRRARKLRLGQHRQFQISRDISSKRPERCSAALSFGAACAVDLFAAACSVCGFQATPMDIQLPIIIDPARDELDMLGGSKLINCGAEARQS
jgi:hypothetical protein